MRNFQELKDLLIQVKENDYNVPEGVDLDALLDDMLSFLGDPDSELRDELICTIFYTWADEEVAAFTTKQMHKILNTCVSDRYLFLGVGENGTDTVFTRSFSSLYIGLALCRHDEDPYLSDEEVENIKLALSSYVRQEKDFRGYVDGKGWAHSMAHVSDALNDLVFCDCLTREDLLEILDTVKVIVLNTPIVYEAGEDDRVATVFESVCEREMLSNEDIVKWLESLDYPFDRTAGEYPQVFYSHINRRHFLRCIYFLLLSLDGFAEVAEYVKEMLKRIEGGDDEGDEDSDE